MFRKLMSGQIVETTRRLRSRVEERFPSSGLRNVASELVSIAEEAQERCRVIGKNQAGLRIAKILLFIIVGIGLISLFSKVRMTEGMWQMENFLEELNAVLGSLFFIGAAIVFVVSFETRLKRRKALIALNELRALAHIVDMHQLTKDPETMVAGGPTTAASPVRTMSRFELSRYFDYCSELLSMIAKIAALYVQSFPDPVALSAVDEIETLCNGLSRKIWQKVMVLGGISERSPDASR